MNDRITALIAGIRIHLAELPRQLPHPVENANLQAARYRLEGALEMLRHLAGEPSGAFQQLEELGRGNPNYCSLKHSSTPPNKAFASPSKHRAAIS